MKKTLYQSMCVCVCVVAALFTSCKKQDLTEVPLLKSTGENNVTFKIPVDSLKKQALSIGGMFYENKSSTKSSSQSVKSIININHILMTKGFTKVTNYDASKPQAYVINFDNNEGFAILADDKRIFNNIIAYSDNGNIDAATDNPGIIGYIQEANGYLAAFQFVDYILIENTIPTGFFLHEYAPNRNQTPYDWGTEGKYKMVYQCGGLPLVPITTITKKLQTKWGQGFPYNKALPRGNDAYYYTGCVATSIAQILSYYSHPANITIGNTTYPINWNSAISGDILGANIHYLMKDIGGKVNMNYKPESSGAYTSNVAPAFRQYGYNPTNATAFNKDVVVSEINSNRVVYMDGVTNDNLGHAWVVDGYLYAKNSTYAVDYVEMQHNEFILVGQRLIPAYQDIIGPDLYLHCNWGWDGKNNGYFINFNVDASFNNNFDGHSTDYNNKRNFNFYKNMIYNIQK